MTATRTTPETVAGRATLLHLGASTEALLAAVDRLAAAVPPGST